MGLLKNLSSRKNIMNMIGNRGDCIEVNAELRRTIQNTLLEMLVDIDSVCKKHNISYFLCGGSCLGAVRHNGFIPWDDDLDIVMKREDYRKFASIFDTEMGVKYNLNAPNYSAKSIARYPKVLKKDSIYVTGDTNDPDLQKLYIDVFIADNVPDNWVHRFIRGMLCNGLEFVSGQVLFVNNMTQEEREANKNYDILSYCIRICIGKMFSWIDISKYNNIIDSVIQYNNNTTKLCSIPTGRKHYFGEILPRTVFEESIKVLFEGYYFPIPKEYDCYLKNLYGDYMEIPPEDKREKHFLRRVEL